RCLTRPSGARILGGSFVGLMSPCPGGAAMRRARRLSLDRLEDRTAPAVLTVTSPDDSGPGSLRAAVAQAELDATPDRIAFAPGLAGGTINLPSVGSVDSVWGASALAITTPITIEGSGQTITRSGPAGIRLFFVDATRPGSHGSLVLSDLRLTNGLARGGDGGPGA